MTPSCQFAYHVLYFFYVNLTIRMNPLSSKAHSLAQTRQTKHRTNRTENQHERATKRILAILAPKFRACADVIQLCPLRLDHSRPQRPRSFWSAPRIATSGLVQRHSVFEWLCKHNRLRPKPIRFVRLDSEHAQSDGKSVNRGLPVLDLARGFTAVKRLGIRVNTRVI